MPGATKRCGSCINCVDITTATSNIRDKKKREKKRKLVSKNRPCTRHSEEGGLPPPKKNTRLSEAETLTAHTSGGEYVPSKQQDPSFAALHRPAKTIRATSAVGAMVLPTYSRKDFAEYKNTVNLCAKVGSADTGGAIGEEYVLIMDKLKSILLIKETARDEIDWPKENEIAKYILSLWQESRPAGESVFRMSVEARQEVLAELTKFMTDLRELEEVELTWFDYFGDDATDVLEEIYSKIPPDLETKLTIDFLKYVFHKATTTDRDLSSVDVRWWLQKYKNSDVSLVLTPVLLPRSQQKKKELEHAAIVSAWSKLLSGQQRCQERKQQNSVIFQDQQEGAVSSVQTRPSWLTDTIREQEEENVSSQKRTTSRLESIGCNLLSVGQHIHQEDKHQRSDIIQQGEKEATSSRKKRTSRLQQLGDTVRRGFQKAGVSRNRINSKHADGIISIVKEGDNQSLSNRAVKDCAEASKEMESILFRKGGMSKVLATLRSFKARPAVREAFHQCYIATMHNDQSIPGETKEEKIHREVFASLKDFFSMFKKKRGRTCLEDQNAIDAALAALSGPNIEEQKLSSTLCRAVGVTRRLLKRAMILRKNLEDKDIKRWVRVPRGEYLNSIRDVHKRKLHELLHTDEFSQTDNMDKREYMVFAGVTEDGKKMYDLHEARRMRYTTGEVFNKLTGYNPRKPNEPKIPHPIWREIQEATRTVKRPNGIKGSTKLLKQCMCRCLRPQTVHFCSCDICVAAEESVRHYNKARHEWRKQCVSSRIRAAPDAASQIAIQTDRFQCNQCSGICHETDGVYRTFSTTAKTCLEAIFCPAVEIKALELPKLDKNGYSIMDGDQVATIPFKSFNKNCCYGQCMSRSSDSRHNTTTTFESKCGWDATFKQCPETTLNEKDIQTGEERTYSMRVCPDEFTDHQCVYKKWQTVTRPSRKDDSQEREDGTFGDNNVATQEEWLPHVGTRRTFMLYLKQSLEIYGKHYWKTHHDRQARLREQYFFLHQPAVQPNHCPVEFKNIACIQSDFSSVLHSIRKEEQTCSRPEAHNCNVIYVTYDSKVETVESIKDVHPRMAKAVEKEGILQRVVARNIAFLAYSKARPSAAYDHVVNDDIVSLLLTGRLLEDSMGEAFHNGKRLPGGSRVHGVQVLPENLAEAEESMPLFPTMTGLRRRRDGCAGQYQGKSAFLGWQTMTARSGVDATDCRNPAKHGKCLADGATMVQKGNIQRSADDAYGPGTQALVRHLAGKYPSPKVNRKVAHFKGRGGLFSTTDYIYLWYPENAFDDCSVVDAAKGYAGSSKDHFYVSKGRMTNDAALLHRQDICTCLPCLKGGKGDFRDCILKDIFPLPKQVRIKPRTITEVTCTRGGGTLESFCEGLVKGEFVVARVDPSDRRKNPEEDYFVGRLQGTPYKLTEPGIYAGNQYNKGWYVVEMQWYERKDEDDAGNYFFERGHSQLLNCNAFVRGLGKNKIHLQYDRRQKLYKLNRSLDEHIQKYGALTS